MIQYIKKYLENSHEILQLTLKDTHFIKNADKAAKSIIATFERGNRVFIAGNGGSAADAQHIAGEFVSRFNFDRNPLPAIALTTDTSILTAIGNDYNYHQVFERQIRALGQSGDLFIGISTSGQSKNILLALEASRALGLFTIGMTGQSADEFAKLCDICLQVPSNTTPFIQQIHITIAHAICGLVEEVMFGK